MLSASIHRARNFLKHILIYRCSLNYSLIIISLSCCSTQEPQRGTRTLLCSVFVQTQNKKMAPASKSFLSTHRVHCGSKAPCKLSLAQPPLRREAGALIYRRTGRNSSLHCGYVAMVAPV